MVSSPTRPSSRRMASSQAARCLSPHLQVLLINDQTSGAGVLLTTTRIRAILRGSTTGSILINNLTPDNRIKPGEQVLTSAAINLSARACRRYRRVHRA